MQKTIHNEMKFGAKKMKIRAKKMKFEAKKQFRKYTNLWFCSENMIGTEKK